jgi:hypothetical protein
MCQSLIRSQASLRLNVVLVGVCTKMTLSMFVLVLAVNVLEGRFTASMMRTSSSPLGSPRLFSSLRRRYDIANERLPTYVPATDQPLESTFPAPSTRPRSPGPAQPFGRSASPGFLYRDTEDDDEIRQLADRVARIRKSGGRYSGPRPDTLKRFDTV